MPAINDPKPRTQAQQDSIDSAMRVIRTIDNLAKSDDFKHFMERHTRRADALALEVLHDDMPVEKREELRHRRLGIMEVLLSLQEDRDAQVRVLAGYGIGVD
jgi:hypothetical protein